MLEIGQVVFALAGRDKGRYFVVLRCDGAYALLSDGKTRRLEKPKRKKMIHLRPTRSFASSEQIGTNREIRKLLAPFRANNT